MLFKISTMSNAALQAKLGTAETGIRKLSNASEDTTILSVLRQQRGALVAELARRNVATLQQAA